MNIFAIVGISIFMGAASYAVGVSPTKFKLSPDSSRSVSGFSLGILIGAAFCLALPEGLEGILAESVDLDVAGRSIEDILDRLPILVGVPLTIGFLLMFLIDNLPSFLTNKDSYFHETPSTPREWLTSIIQSSLTITLVLHSIIDGVSLGSAFKKDDISYLFAAIIIIHKLPTAFSLGCLLLNDDMSDEVVKFHVGVFAATTPVMAIATWFLLLVLNADKFIIGLLVIFSTGNFVYVVCHVMQNLCKDNHSEQGSLTPSQICITLGGTLIPLLLSFVHH